jgi:hypothetical protein
MFSKRIEYIMFVTHYHRVTIASIGLSFDYLYLEIKIDQIIIE